MVIQIDYKTINWLDCKLQSNIFASDLIIFIDFVDFFFKFMKEVTGAIGFLDTSGQVFT